MTITLNLNIITFLDDLKVLQQIFNAGKPELVEPMSNYMTLKNLSSTPYVNGNVEIHVTMEEFALIGIFNKGIK